MAEVSTEELETLQREFDWLLSQEVPAVLSQLREAVTECASKFPVPVGSHNADRPNSSDKFVLTTTDQLKVVVTLTGDSISAAEINLKLPRPHAKDAYHNTGVREDVPWKLQQVDRAGKDKGSSWRSTLLCRYRTQPTTCIWPLRACNLNRRVKSAPSPQPPR